MSDYHDQENLLCRRHIWAKPIKGYCNRPRWRKFYWERLLDEFVGRYVTSPPVKRPVGFQNWKGQE